MPARQVEDVGLRRKFARSPLLRLQVHAPILYDRRARKFRIGLILVTTLKTDPLEAGTGRSGPKPRAPAFLMPLLTEVHGR